MTKGLVEIGIRRILILIALINTAVLGAGAFAFINRHSPRFNDGLRQTLADGEQTFNQFGCASCHGVDARTPAIALYPSLGGLSKAYMRQQIIDIRDGTRTNGFSGLMRNQIQGMTDDQVRTVVEFVTHQ